MYKLSLCLFLVASPFLLQTYYAGDIQIKDLEYQNPSNTIWTANWSHDGKYIATGGNDSILRVFDGISYKLLNSYKLNEWIFRVRWHPTLPLLAVAAEGSESHILDVPTGQKIAFQDLENHGSRSIAWNASGQYIVYADYEGLISIWTKNGQLVRKIPKPETKSYVAVDWHPLNDEIIALAGKIRIYSFEGQLLDTLSHRKEDVLMLCVKWHPSGEFYFLGDYGANTEQITPLLQKRSRIGVLLWQSDISQAEYRNMSWSPNGKYLATASDALRIWSTEGDLLHTGISDDLLWGVDWSPDGKRIVTTSMEGNIRIWNSSGEKIEDIHY